ncbi:MAG: endonuclease MutS2 [Chloroflexi bacterium HGW-Chloroflexi-5]|jgi:DNA mismatch repair protein MutS2|nr:MAG: endonuclease MutS2 [Chloroflexi bacterium HGW-Chloroflexi-5]
MDEKTLKTLEFHKVIEKLAGFAAFSASAELAHALRPAATLAEALERQAKTTEARRLLSIKLDMGVGGAHDIRPLAEMARRGGVLTESDLLSVSGTLISARSLHRSFDKQAKDFPHLAEIVRLLPPPPGVIESISRCISDRGEVLDSASAKLGSIRSEIKISHARLMSKLERMISDSQNSSMLQEAIITQRNGRYVIPLRAEYRSKLKSIVHDQSSSGATLFVEPIAVVELNNRWHEMQLQERDEIRKILTDLSNKVGAEASAICGIVDALALLDFTLMCAKYGDELKASEPLLKAVSPPAHEHHPGTCIKLLLARHPLLEPATVVPIDVDLDAQTFAVIITGPNTGGKTVTLKTVGLMILMAQCGLHIPAQSGSELSFFDDIFADIGDEQSIEQSLSTFSGHITNIVCILTHARTKTLVLLDELGAGTDPQEGSALARAIMLYLVERRIPCLIATHYPELKALAHATPGVTNASMEFNLKTLRPTYRLTLGIPGRSNALSIAKRLNLPDEILDSAKTMIDPNELKSEDLLKEIHYQREVARKARSAADRERSLILNQKEELARRLDEIEDERRKELEKARSEAENELAGLRQEMDEVRRELQRARQPIEALKTLEEKISVAEEKASKPVVRKNAPKQSRTEFIPKPGARVKLRSLNMEGVITSIGEHDMEVQIGSLRVRAKMNDLMAPNAEEEKVEVAAPRKTRGKVESTSTPAASPFRPSPGMEIDLRGQRAEDALDALDRYISNASMAGLPFVRIIHGKGTGRLRQVIREALKVNDEVKSYEEGGDKEGGEGVTVVHLE